MNSEEKKDEYEIELEKVTLDLKACQIEKNFDSCMNCDAFFDCKIRKEYVKATYNSMSKGQSGGFEF